MTEYQQDPLLVVAEEGALDLDDQPNKDDESPLDHAEIEEARIRIMGLHPYRNAKMLKLFPMLGCCFCECCFTCCQKDVAEEIQKMKDLKEFERETEGANLQKTFDAFGVVYNGSGPRDLHEDAALVASPEDDDPLKGLGFGFEAYWRMLYSMSGMFLLLTLIFVPELLMNITTGGMRGIRNYPDSALTLGNLGFSASNCMSQYLGIEESRYLSCNVGNLDTLVAYGMIPNDTSQEMNDGEYYDYSDYSSSQNYYAYCNTPVNALTSKVPIPGILYCSSNFMKNGTFEAAFASCKEESSSNCSFNFKDYYYSNYEVYTTDAAKNASLVIQDEADYEWCTAKTARMYVQYTCIQTEREIDGKRYAGLGIVCIGFLGICCYSLQVFYLTHTAKLDFKLWDLSTLTAADFTAEMTITEDMWQNHFLEMSRVQERVPTHAAPSMAEMRGPVTTLYANLENAICTRLNKLPMVINENPNIRIAHISFAFDNKEIIELLLKRGVIIVDGKFTKLKEINQKIDDCMEKHKEKIERPVAAFITFENQEGFERGVFYFPHHTEEENHEFDWVDPVTEEDKQFLGKKLELKRATEPANILWENRHTTGKEIILRSMVTGIVTLIVLIGALGLFIFLMKVTTINQLKYPPAQQCDNFNQMFSYDYSLINSTYYKWANFDKPFTEAEQGVGIYQCYCMEMGTDDLIAYGKEALCYDFDKDYAHGFIVNNVVTVGITLVNMIIRDVSIVMINYIGFHTETEQTAAIMSLITVATFFNTAILMLLANANTEGTVLSWLPLRGTMTDLNLNWYTDIADALVYTMLINSVYVYLGFVMQACMMIVFRSLDKGCGNFWACREVDQTKAKTIQQYVNLYAGPIHLMHFKYATCMNTIYTVFMYGLAIPVMFPIAALTFINIYLVEKLCVAYWYQKPPMYGPELNDAALGMMRWAPLTYFIFGYWIMGQKQIFNNVTPEVTYSNVAVPSDHNGWPWNENGPAVPMFFFLVAFLVVMCCGNFFAMCLKKFNMSQDTDEIEVDEQLGNYFETLPNHSRKNWLATELNNSNRLGIKTFGAGTYDQLANINGKTKVMKNSINYNILSNPLYMTLFQYVPMTQRDNLEESTTSDMVTSAIYNAQKKEGFQAGQSFTAVKHSKPKVNLNQLFNERQAAKMAGGMGQQSMQQQMYPDVQQQPMY